MYAIRNLLFTPLVRPPDLNGIGPGWPLIQTRTVNIGVLMQLIYLLWRSVNRVLRHDVFAVFRSDLFVPFSRIMGLSNSLLMCSTAGSSIGSSTSVTPRKC